MVLFREIDCPPIRLFYIYSVPYCFFLPQVDEFVTNSFTLEKLPESEEGNLFRTLLTTAKSFLEVGKNIEVGC